MCNEETTDRNKVIRLIQKSETVVHMSRIPYLFKEHYGSSLDYSGKLMTWLSEIDCLEIKEGRIVSLHEPVKSHVNNSHLEGEMSVKKFKGEDADVIAAAFILEKFITKFHGKIWPISRSQIKIKLNDILETEHETFDGNMCEWFKILNPSPYARLSKVWRDHDLIEGNSSLGYNWNTTYIKTWINKLSPNLTITQAMDTVGEVNSTNKLLNEEINSNCGNLKKSVLRDVTQITETAELTFKAFSHKTSHMAEIVNVSQFQDLLSKDNFFYPADIGDSRAKIHVAFHCEINNHDISLLVIITRSKSYIFDCALIGLESVCRPLLSLLANNNVIKLVHNLRSIAPILREKGGVQIMCGMFDSQLAMELLTKNMSVPFSKMLRHFKGNGDDKAHFATKDARKSGTLLWEVRDLIVEAMGTSFDIIQRASDVRAMLGISEVVFDMDNEYAMMSTELANELCPNSKFQASPIDIRNDIDDLLRLLPTDMQNILLEIGTEDLSEIILDKGKLPLCWVGGKREFLDKVCVVQQSDIDQVVSAVGGFGTDNRAGLEKQLHRISGIRNRSGDVIGLTLRVGRHIHGNADMIADLLLGSDKSILFLGEPGSGKTTIIREATRLLAEKYNVCIVDTSNEIAGDGDIPHDCVGHARRMMVKSLDLQSKVMVECVQNHTPTVMVIDEIGRSSEVEAARTCKQRGVRMVASAHGDLRKLRKNPKLRGLIGGVETITLGDSAAKEQAKIRGDSSLSKLKSERGGEPVFDVIIELRRGMHHEWIVVLDTARAVDDILEGSKYDIQRRIRDPVTGNFDFSVERC